MTDLERLSQWYRIEITQLEAQLEEVKRKHDILVEASRLVEEEILKPYRATYQRLSNR